MNERQYREHWATLTGRPVREVYVPVALRETGRHGGPTPEQAARHRKEARAIRNHFRTQEEPTLESVQEMLDNLSNDGPRTDEEDGA